MKEAHDKFEAFCAERGIQLVPWQRAAAKQILTVLGHQSGHRSGKSTLLSLLAQFDFEHGNEIKTTDIGDHPK